MRADVKDDSKSTEALIVIAAQDGVAAGAVLDTAAVGVVTCSTFEFAGSALLLQLVVVVVVVVVVAGPLGITLLKISCNKPTTACTHTIHDTRTTPCTRCSPHMFSARQESTRVFSRHTDSCTSSHHTSSQGSKGKANRGRHIVAAHSSYDTSNFAFECVCCARCTKLCLGSKPVSEARSSVACESTAHSVAFQWAVMRQAAVFQGQCWTISRQIGVVAGANRIWRTLAGSNPRRQEFMQVWCHQV